MLKIFSWIVCGGVTFAALAFIGLQLWFIYSVQAADPFVPTQKEQERLAFYQQPESWFLENIQGPREIVDGQTLDPKLQYMVEESRSAARFAMRLAPLIFATPWGRASIRNDVDRSWQLYSKITSPMAHVENRTIDGRNGPIPVRIYRPVSGDEPLPVLVYFHGGGWIFSSIAAMDRVARLIANEAGVIVISVNYRLAPEHPYPAASDDGEDAFLWARSHADTFGGNPAHIAVGGDSAGGHIAINTAQRQIKAGQSTPAAMLLFYPGAGLPQADPSYRLFGQGYALDAAFIEFILPRVFKNHYLEREAEIDDLMNPAGAKNLKGLPPTIIATAGFDILRDSARRFAERIEADDVPVHYANYPSLTHSFLQFSGVVKDADTASTQNAQMLGKVIRDPLGARTIFARPAG